MTDKPSLPALEYLVAKRRNADALLMVQRILQAIDNGRGGLGGVELDASYAGASDEDIAVVFATRFATAFGYLLSGPELDLTPDSYERLLTQHRWIDLMFFLSGFHSSDNFLSLIASDAGNGKSKFAGVDLFRLLAMLTLNTSLNVDFNQLWRANQTASAVAFLNYISSRYVFSERAFAFRERLLEWLPKRLSDVRLGAVTLARLPEYYMFCSYAVSARKHAIKRSLMDQTRRICGDAGIVEPATFAAPADSERPTVVVIGEQFLEGHATFRCFAPAVESLRSRFKVIGVIHPDPVGTPVAGYFDRCIAIPQGDFLASVRGLAAAIVAQKPALVLYLGVGMIAQIIALASLRLAPIQCASIGHNASTMSPAIDYFILPEDWVASPECFSEKIVPLPKAAMPFLRPPFTSEVRHRPADGIIRVAIRASMMKLNPILFDAIARIAAGAKAPVEFHFFPGAPIGLSHFALLRVVRAKIRRAIVHPQLPYQHYMERLLQCDFFLSPFPHGGMTSVMDAFQLGMPGVCLDGREPHSHADAAIFARINLPAELVAHSIGQYVETAIRLIDDERWRQRCTEIVRTADLEAAFFTGNPGQFCRAIEELIRSTQQSGRKDKQPAPGRNRRASNRRLGEN